ncbi:MAG TPA: chemotaxis protein CheB [Candidatus Angelobacter sp.]|nr:chemotaxis protein CheB [Candidatus Angelobacter sp.]
MPRTFPSSIVVVQHLAPGHKSWIANLLNRSTPWKVKQAEHGEILLPGMVYTAPPDEHCWWGRGRSNWRTRSWCISRGLPLTCCLSRWPALMDRGPLPWH